MYEIPQKECSTCKKKKIVHEFHLTKRPGTFSTQCKECMKKNASVKPLTAMRKTINEGHLHRGNF